MIVHLGNTTLENIKLDKDFVSKEELNLSLKDKTNILTPILILKTNSLLTIYNYCYIPDFGRYYYIINYESIRDNLFEISCKVDVLMSFKNQIRANKGLITRQQNRNNNYYVDRLVPLQSNPIITIADFPNKQFTNTGGTFILSTTGSVDSQYKSTGTNEMCNIVSGSLDLNADNKVTASDFVPISLPINEYIQWCNANGQTEASLSSLKEYMMQYQGYDLDIVMNKFFTPVANQVISTTMGFPFTWLSNGLVKIAQTFDIIEGGN